MSRPARPGLKSKLFLMLVALVLIPLLLLSVLAYYLSLSSVEKNTAYTLSSVADDKMAELDYFYRNVTEILTTTASSTDMLQFFNYQDSGNAGGQMLSESLMTLSSRIDYLLSLYNHCLDSIAVIPYDRSNYMMIRRAPSSRHYDSLYFESFGEQIRTAENELGVEWGFSGHLQGGEMLWTARTHIYSGSRDRFMGVLSCIVNMDFIVRTLESLHGDGTVAILTESGGMPVYSNQPAGEAEAWLSAARAGGEADAAAAVHIENKRYLRVCSASEHTGWRLYLFAPYESFAGNLRTIPPVIVSVSLLYLAYSLVLARHFFSVIYTPIRRLADDMSNMSYESINVQLEPRATDELIELELGFNKMKSDIAALIENVRTEQEQKKEIEIRALRAQIMPHFLYNTLNSIKSLISLGETQASSDMLVAFISLLRVSVDNTDDYIHFYEEINYLRHYILIMNHRYSRKIELALDLDETLLTCKTPKFILQPIVENSIIHGFGRWNGEQSAVINVVMRRDGGDILITITDNGRGIEPELLALLNLDLARETGKSNRFSNIGINNIQERLRLLFGPGYGISVGSEAGEGTKIVIRLPEISD